MCGFFRRLPKPGLSEIRPYEPCLKDPDKQGPDIPEYHVCLSARSQATAQHTLALTDEGHVCSFGGGSYGQLGVKDVGALVFLAPSVWKQSVRTLDLVRL